MDSQRLRGKMTLPLLAVKQILDKKTIAIIGNAESIFQHRYGVEIDEHDVVIRINKGFIKDPEAQGHKTTIWAGSYPLQEEDVTSLFSPEICMWMTPKLSVMPEYSDSFLAKTFVHPREIWDDLYKALSETRPTTGMMLINFIHKYTDAKSMTLYGFDFFHTKTFYEPKLRTNTPHNFSSEEQMVRELIENKANIIIKGYDFTGNTDAPNVSPGFWASLRKLIRPGH